MIIIFLGYLIIVPSSWFSKNKKARYHWGTRVWAKSLLAIIGIQVEVKGIENLQPGQNYIFASNHSSTLDIPVLDASLPDRFLFVLREDLFKIPFLGRYARNTGHLSLNLKDPRKSYQDMKNIIKMLQAGESIVYFPQGGRRSGVSEFKSGIGIIATESQAPVIPLAICNSAEFMPRKSFSASSGTIKVLIGKPVQFDKNKDHEEVAEEIKKIIANNINLMS